MIEPVGQPPKIKVSISDVAQAFAVAAPFLYLVGRQYDNGYYKSIGAEWALQLISFQETITHSILPICIVLGGLITGLYFLYNNFTFKKILKSLLFSWIAMAVLFGVALLVADDVLLAKRIAVFTIQLMLYGFGIYIADTLFALTRDDRTYRNFSVMSSLIASGFAISFTPSLGALSAESDLEARKYTLARLIEKNSIYTTNDTYLVSAIGGKFLTVDFRKDNGRQFKLENDLSKFIIKPIPQRYNEINE